MLRDNLLAVEAAAVVFLVAALLLLVPICIVHYRRYGYLKPTRAVVFYSFLFYALCVIFLVVLPLPELTPDFCEVHTLARQVHLIPFHFVGDIIRADAFSIRHLNVISVLESEVFLQAFLNFLMLLPLGFYLRYYFRLEWRPAVAIAIATALVFELSQLTALFGLYPCPYRTFDVDDLLLNTTGAMVGFAIMPLVMVYLPDLQHHHRRPTRVSPFRRWVAFVIDWFLANSVARLLSFWMLPTFDHPLWLDFGVYGLWFIGIPLLWQGQTVGKVLVLIRLTRLSGSQVRARQLCLRYGLLIAFPVLTEVAFRAWASHRVIGPWAMALLGLALIEFLALAGLVVWRHDHRGLHDLVAKTHHQLLA